MKKALIAGVNGQDGSYLAEFLLNKGYEVHGSVMALPKDGADPDFLNIGHILDKIKLQAGDITDPNWVRKIISDVKPEEFYHLAAITDARIIFEDEPKMLNVNLMSAHHFLRAVKEICPSCRVFLAGSSMMFGNPDHSPQDEQTPFNPINPYGIAKTAAFHLVKMYREAYNLHASTGILFNHESPRRELRFLPRKITNAAARIKAGLEKELMLGDIEIKRDWGFAGDFIEAMWLMLQQAEADDYVIGTGQLHSIKDILSVAFSFLGLDWHQYVKLDEKFVRQEEPREVLANPARAREKLGWVPKTSFEDLIKMMVRKDLERVGV